MEDTVAKRPPPAIVGRSSSHFTRLVRLFAHETGAACRFEPVYDLASVDPDDYAGNPALKMPVLRIGGQAVFGAENICRTLVEQAPAPRRVVWPEDLRDVASRNAQELVWHAMQAQVQLAFGTQVAGLPVDSVYFAKAGLGLRNTLAWLEERMPAVLAALPARDLSLLEAALFCLVEHLAFRDTLSLAPYPQLTGFARAFGARPSAQATAYAFDVPPAR
ncbi:hypothetical protein ASG87_03565 [Frateuria sp. Soil773]|nr:hypothetical protein ASG87_03565 [Frateuria sp. Soil773]